MSYIRCSANNSKGKRCGNPANDRGNFCGCHDRYSPEYYRQVALIKQYQENERKRVQDEIEREKEFTRNLELIEDKLKRQQECIRNLRLMADEIERLERAKTNDRGSGLFLWLTRLF